MKIDLSSKTIDLLKYYVRLSNQINKQQTSKSKTVENILATKLPRMIRAQEKLDKEICLQQLDKLKNNRTIQNVTKLARIQLRAYEKDYIKKIEPINLP